MGDDENTRDTLKGLAGVYVHPYVNPNLETSGLTTDNIRTDVELRIRKAGIHVIRESEVRSTTGMPVLMVDLNGRETPEESNKYFFMVDIHLQQRVIIPRNNLQVDASTWFLSGGGYSPRDNPDRYIRDTLGDIVDRFVNAFLAANPKKYTERR
jgi:hypothetical protein